MAFNIEGSFKKIILIFGSVILAIAIIGPLFFILSGKLENEEIKLSREIYILDSNAPDAPDAPEELPLPSFNLFFVGDIMLSRGVGQKTARGNDWRWPFLKISSHLRRADLLFGNLEGPISDKGYDTGSVYSFRADPRVVEGLVFAGFDVLSLANNHMGDWSREAMEDTFKILKDGGINYVGAGLNFSQAHSPLVKELSDGTKIAFLAYTNIGPTYWQAGDDLSGIAWLEKEQMKEDIEKAKEKADLIIVSMHSGTEYVNHSNLSQRDYARSAIDAGANLIVGHHPHVVQEIEEYKGRYIAYSLGNFIFDQTFSEETMKGLLLNVIIENKQIKEVRPVGVRISKDFQPEIASL